MTHPIPPAITTTSEPPVRKDLGDWLSNTIRRTALPFKVAMIGILILLLLIPLGMVQSTLNERLQRREGALGEITSTWGRSQNVIGPVLVLPYRIPVVETQREVLGGKIKTVQVKKFQEGSLYLLPAQLKIHATMSPDVRYKGIFQTVVYSAAIKIDGTFNPPDLAKFNLKPENIDWANAVLTLAVSDLRGVRDTIPVRWDSREIVMLPGSRLPHLEVGIQAPLQLKAALTTATPFSTEFKLNGSGPLRFAPVGMKTETRLISPWPDPSFSGAFLPSDRKVTHEGFDATWNLSYYGRGYPQEWTQNQAPTQNALESTLFGAELLALVDFYRNVERAIKYGVLFLALVFGAFFLFETVAKLSIHFLQYLLVGAALCLFYLALLALSEFLPFSTAYAAAALASLLLISLYAFSFLRTGLRVLGLSAGLGTVFAYLYVLLQLQDYSLLFGTIGLFVLLGAVMFATRNLTRPPGSTVGSPERH